MKILLQIARFCLLFIGGIFEFLFASISIYFLIAIICSIIPVNGDSPQDGLGIYVKSNGVHTDICLPVNTEYYDWTTFIPPSDFAELNNFEFISIGWGDKGFFLDTPEWSDLTVSTALNAAFLPSPTAMHVAYLEHAPGLGENVKFVLMERSKYGNLIKYVQKSFKLDKGQVDLIPNSGYWYNDNFYEAHGNYHLFRTCNAWTNDALKIAGIRTALLGLFSDGIMRHLD